MRCQSQHGGPGFKLLYLQPDLQPLAQNRRVIYCDQRGAGRSTVSSDAMLINLDRHVADLESVRTFFKLEKFDVLGHSWGAALGAHKYPGRVGRLLLVDKSLKR